MFRFLMTYLPYKDYGESQYSDTQIIPDIQFWISNLTPSPSPKERGTNPSIMGQREEHNR